MALPTRPAMIAVEGHGGSGKSTLARKLAEHLDAVIITGDDFYRVMPEEERAALNPEQGYRLYFDDERMRDEALLPLKAGKPARYRQYNWEHGGGLGAVVELPACPFVIVERTYVTRPELRSLYDFIVYVKTPPAERQARLAARTWDDPVWTARWEAAELWFHMQENPEEYADAVVSGASL
nr:AAA family ATPase [Deinococcus reticulitermitis]